MHPLDDDAAHLQMVCQQDSGTLPIGRVLLIGPLNGGEGFFHPLRYL